MRLLHAVLPPVDTSHVAAIKYQNARREGRGWLRPWKIDTQRANSPFDTKGDQHLSNPTTGNQI